MSWVRSRGMTYLLHRDLTSEFWPTWCFQTDQPNDSRTNPSSRRRHKLIYVVLLLLLLFVLERSLRRWTGMSSFYTLFLSIIIQWLWPRGICQQGWILGDYWANFVASLRSNPVKTKKEPRLVSHSGSTPKQIWHWLSSRGSIGQDQRWKAWKETQTFLGAVPKKHRVSG